jgi:hypothetical protein
LIHFVIELTSSASFMCAYTSLPLPSFAILYFSYLPHVFLAFHSLSFIFVVALTFQPDVHLASQLRRRSALSALGLYCADGCGALGSALESKGD